jgi:hypothetical protein
VDGTIKRVYQLHDNTYIESVLMGPYNDGRYTACKVVSFVRLDKWDLQDNSSLNEIFEQVSRFHAELLLSSSSSSSSDPLNDQNQSTTKIAHGKQNVYPMLFLWEWVRYVVFFILCKQWVLYLLYVKLLRIVVVLTEIMMTMTNCRVYFHNSDWLSVYIVQMINERTTLLPANSRNGGLNALIEALKEYCDVTWYRTTYNH